MGPACPEDERGRPLRHSRALVEVRDLDFTFQGASVRVVSETVFFFLAGPLPVVGLFLGSVLEACYEEAL